ncbi:unnamed protein product [Prorocentrum cordatum]|uniref:C2H2-type domain-containing protein n=1 Tax=Prorocentrum cordatum TaxID=2364126 RepID=A0ABN9VTW6_9DINO|nr:unnamed protein product [Polarella glacialis]
MRRRRGVGVPSAGTCGRRGRRGFGRARLAGLAATALVLTASAAAWASSPGPVALPPGRALPKPPPAGQGRPPADPLSAQLRSFVAGALPSRRDRGAKEELLAELRAAAVEAFGQGALVLPFGSSANGCGEAHSDLDATVHVPAGGWRSRSALRRLQKRLFWHDISVVECRLGAPVPILVLQSRDGLECDLSYQNMVPLHNTLLVRTYAELAPELTGLSIVVKRWAKNHNIAGTHVGSISSYAWTLMVIYYLQVCHGLPSLHQLAPLDRAHRFCHSMAPEFTDLETARALMAAECAGQWSSTRGECGGLLRGFFRFYAVQFGWAHEVVSVRLGRRANISSATVSGPLFHMRGPISTQNCLHIEDPIEIKNHNYALSDRVLGALRREISRANELLEAGGSLTELLDPFASLDHRAVASSTMAANQGHESWLEGFIRIAQHIPPLPCKCHTCGVLLDHLTMAQHLRWDQCRGGPADGNGWGCAGCAAFFASPDRLEAHQSLTGHWGHAAPWEVLDVGRAASGRHPRLRPASSEHTPAANSFFREQMREHQRWREHLRQLRRQRRPGRPRTGSGPP